MEALKKFNRKQQLNFILVLLLCISVLIGVTRFKNGSKDLNFSFFLLPIFTFSLAQVLRAFRLKFLLLGSNRDRDKESFILVYWLSNILSIFAGAKIGDFFRVISYSRSRPVLVVLAAWISERFFDVFTLVSLIIINHFFNKSSTAFENNLPIIGFLAFSSLLLAFFIWSAKAILNFFISYILKTKKIMNWMYLIKLFASLSDISGAAKKMITKGLSFLFITSIVIWALEMVGMHFIIEFISSSSSSLLEAFNEILLSTTSTQKASKIEEMILVYNLIPFCLFLFFTLTLKLRKKF